MRVTFVGVGEAFDESLPNTSLFVESGDTSLLLDCGFTVPHAFWALPGTDALDGVYLSHYHADHWFGLPVLITRFVEEGRTRPLTVLGQPGVQERVVRLTGLAYPNSLAKAGFPVGYEECEPGREVRFGPFRLTFAPGDHPVTNLAVRVDGPDGSLFYSGDGRPTPETRALAKGCALVVHEAFSLDPDKAGHGTVAGSLAFARQAGAQTLALVHIRRQVRRGQETEIRALAEAEDGLRVLLPGPGDIFTM